jgi:pre-60S factor REI1
MHNASFMMPTGAKASPAGYTVKAPHQRAAAAAVEQQEDEQTNDDDDDDDDSDTEESGWETASDDDEQVADEHKAAAGRGSRVTAKHRGAAAAAVAAAVAADSGDGEEQQEVAEEDWEEWDVCVSFFDNKRSGSMQENLEYMFKRFGFYLPDAEYLTDPEGLLKYLGAKLQYGQVGEAVHTSQADERQADERQAGDASSSILHAYCCSIKHDDGPSLWFFSWGVLPAVHQLLPLMSTLATPVLHHLLAVARCSC